MTKNVLLIGCAYPPELPYFTRGVAQTGARVFGVDQMPESQLPPMVRECLSGYCQTPLHDEQQAFESVRRWAGSRTFDRVESLWEPMVLLAARLREGLGAPGMRHEQVLRFRDKDKMKQAVAEAGLRTPRHERANNGKECFPAAEHVGFPVCLKPIAGAGSEHTFRVDSLSDMERALKKAGYDREYNIEEWIEAEEYTFDTICIDGRIVHENMSWYRPRPLVGRSTEWISPQTVTLRDLHDPHLEAGRTLGQKVLKALGHESGFTHMEWYHKDDDEAIFGEIAARPPGAHTVDTMNFASDIDLFVGWAEAVVHGKFSPAGAERLYNCAIIFKRAQGQGYIRRVDGLERLLAAYGEHIPAIELLPIGAHRRDWVRTLLSDGFVFVRHPDLDTTCEIADHVGTDLQMYASA